MKQTRDLSWYTVVVLGECGLLEIVLGCLRCIGDKQFKSSTHEFPPPSTYPTYLLSHLLFLLCTDTNSLILSPIELTHSIPSKATIHAHTQFLVAAARPLLAVSRAMGSSVTIAPLAVLLLAVMCVWGVGGVNVCCEVCVGIV